MNKTPIVVSIKRKIHAGIWKCAYCGRESIQIGTENGSSDTICPGGCPGNFTLIKRYPLATGLNGIMDAFKEAELNAD